MQLQFIRVCRSAPVYSANLSVGQYSWVYVKRSCMSTCILLRVVCTFLCPNVNCMLVTV